MLTEAQYRRGTSQDLLQIVELACRSYGVYKNVLDEQNWVVLQRFLTDQKAFGNLIKQSQPFVCEYQAQVIGMAFLLSSGNPTEIYPADWSYIRMLGVDPAFAGNGIARKLTGICIDKARADGETVIALHTSEFMDAARHLYESMGFKALKEISPRLGKCYWLYTLQLS